MTGVSECSQQRGNLKDNGYISAIKKVQTILINVSKLLLIKLMERIRFIRPPFVIT
ncbi:MULTISPECIES: hypothetical protein [Photorhabdus]|uniref:Transposase DDE domain-containing protein n=2 Tax=Photorhabdus TaxID=29487 RepID=A0ABX0AY29_9GAMM|nr:MULTISPECIES: hypothetical protein [Photorhabdus]MCT8352523.1 hypothetical protein [Photorhabdus kayaii]MDB6366520.1 hypothetical protein [Photorhabdus bodei]MDB6373634.1 hypothetical protein [Photorhabdus bodei]NDL12236.1 hypothetical protein [Photorhabdus kayaii]NDL25762.1 hypothetical protein [Photorhabdus kayaii]